MIAKFERLALDHRLTEELHTCISDLCWPEREVHYRYDETRPPRGLDEIRVTWRDRAMLVLDALGSIGL